MFLFYSMWLDWWGGCCGEAVQVGMMGWWYVCGCDDIYVRGWYMDVDDIIMDMQLIYIAPLWYNNSNTVQYSTDRCNVQSCQ